MRIGLIGFGTHGRESVLPGITKYSKRSRLVAVADRNMKQAAMLAPLPRFTSVTSMLDAVELDTVYVATGVETHHELVMAALRAGKHVVCEKPLASTVEECHEMVDAAIEAGRQLFVTFETRYHPPNRKLRSWLDAGHLGVLEAIHLQHMWDGHKAFGPKAERRARLMANVGAFDCGVHKLDLIRYFGGGNWKSVRALGAWFGESMKYPPHVAVLGELDNGVVATLNASMAYASQIEPRPMLETTVLVGREGVVSVAVDEPDPEQFYHSTATLKLHSRHHQESVAFSHPSHSQVIGEMLDDVARTVIDGEPALPALASGEDGLQSLWAVEQAHADILKVRHVPHVESIGAPV